MVKFYMDIMCDDLFRDWYVLVGMMNLDIGKLLVIFLVLVLVILMMFMLVCIFSWLIVGIGIFVVKVIMLIRLFWS